jgi:hypothetical protein
MGRDHLEDAHHARAQLRAVMAAAGGLSVPAAWSPRGTAANLRRSNPTEVRYLAS